MAKLTDRLLIAGNLVILALVLFVFLRPGGALRNSIDKWRQERALKKTLAAEWQTMVSTGGRLDTGAGEALLVEFSDYQCPFCQQAHAMLDSMVAADSTVGIVYRHFPLANHSAAPGAARTSICAEQQGKFREMDHHLFETREWQADTNWVKAAVAAGIADTAAFRACLASPATANRLSSDLSLGNRLGVNGTPTFFTPAASQPGVLSQSQMVSFLESVH